ncbi:MAG: hypothetical protein GY928_36150 [Colwellia sp.]|nr:hypothetical protein [Colwellia sp.]
MTHQQAYLLQIFKLNPSRDFTLVAIINLIMTRKKVTNWGYVNVRGIMQAIKDLVTFEQITLTERVKQDCTGKLITVKFYHLI